MINAQLRQVTFKVKLMSHLFAVVYYHVLLYCLNIIAVCVGANIKCPLAAFSTS